MLKIRICIAVGLGALVWACFRFSTGFHFAPFFCLPAFCSIAAVGGMVGFARLGLAGRLVALGQPSRGQHGRIA